jgi:YgiT-type zinc finger domain-containing protein
MKCVICKHGETSDGVTTMTFALDDLTLVIRNVPARVCDICGEAYVDESTTRELLRTAEDAQRSGVLVEVREFVAA